LEHRDSLLGGDGDESAAHLVRTLELKPVTSAFKDLKVGTQKS